MSDLSPPGLTLYENPLPPSQAPGLGFGIQNPIQGLLMGQSVGTNLMNNQLIGQQNKMNAEAVERAKAQAMELAQAQANNEKEAVEIAQRLANWTSKDRGSDYARLSQITDKDKFEQAQKAFEALNLEQQNSVLQEGGTIVSYLRGNDPQGAIDFITQREEAAKRVGDMKSLANYNSVKQIIAGNKDPQGAATLIEYQLSAYPGSKDMIESLGKIHGRAGQEDLTAAQAEKERAAAGKDIADAASTKGKTPYEIELLRQQAIETKKQGLLHDRMPTGGSGPSPQELSSEIAQASQSINKLDSVLNGFNEIVKTGNVPLTGGLGWASAIAGDIMGGDNPATQWRHNAKTALSTAILEQLKVLRPASDKDIKWLEENLGKADTDPVTALNMIYGAKKLLEYKKARDEAIVAGKPIPTPPDVFHNTDGGFTGGPYSMKDGKFMFEGQKFIPGVGLQQKQGAPKYTEEERRSRITEVPSGQFSAPQERTAERPFIRGVTK